MKNYLQVFLLVLFLLLLGLPGYAAAAELPGNAQDTYTVLLGDNLYDIGLKYGLAPKELMQANKLQTTTIQPGQLLRIPRQLDKITQVSRGAFRDREVDLLARLIEAEAAAEPYQAKVAVGAVVLNRVNSPKYPNTIYEVIYQSRRGTYQFTPVFNGHINRPAGPDAVRAAEESLRGADPTNGALFFFESRVTEKHLRSRTVSIIIGNLTFAF